MANVPIAAVLDGIVAFYAAHLGTTIEFIGRSPILGPEPVYPPCVRKVARRLHVRLPSVTLSPGPPQQKSVVDYVVPVVYYRRNDGGAGHADSLVAEAQSLLDPWLMNWRPSQLRDPAIPGLELISAVPESMTFMADLSDPTGPGVSVVELQIRIRTRAV